jgi:hypothetical protein
MREMKLNRKSGALMVSLDVELSWGVRDTDQRSSLGAHSLMPKSRLLCGAATGETVPSLDLDAITEALTETGRKTTRLCVVIPRISTTVPLCGLTVPISEAIHV